MISSCSRWMVPMMSPMWPVRAWPRADRSAPGPPRTSPSESSRSPPPSPFATPPPPAAGGTPTAAVGVDEVLVLEPEHRAAPHGEMAAPGQALRVQAGGPVERLGHRGPPVHHQRLVVRARDGETPDVEGLAQHRSSGGRGTVPRFGQTVDAPEVERLVADVELLQAGQAGAHHDVALGARLERAAPAEIEHALEHLARLAPHELQPVVGTVEELLLIVQIRMFGHLSPSSPRPTGKRFSLDAPRRPGSRGGDAYDEPDRKDWHADLDHERRSRLQGHLGAG